MLKQTRSLAIAAAAMLAVAAPVLLLAPAPAAAEYRLTDRDRADVARIETYLNTVESVKSEFVQLASGGRFARGTLYIERPKRLRLDYHPPSTIQVFANGNWLAYVDTHLEEVSYIPMSSTPAGFLVQDRIRLSGKVTVDRVTRGPKTISVDLVETDDRESGHFVLTFADQPLLLRQWTVVDGQGVTTNVQLIEPEFNAAIPRAVFQFDDSKFAPREFRQ